MRRVVITGLGTVNPLGNHVEEFWANVKANKIGIKPVDQFDASDFDVKFVGSVKDFDPTEFIEKKEARKMDRFTQFAVCSTMQALNMAGTDLKDLDPFRVGVIIGIGIGGIAGAVHALPLTVMVLSPSATVISPRSFSLTICASFLTVSRSNDLSLIDLSSC